MSFIIGMLLGSVITFITFTIVANKEEKNKRDDVRKQR